MPNLGSKISGHNKKLLSKEAEAGSSQSRKKGCNCLPSNVAECPLPGLCNSDGVVYQATVDSTGNSATYVGLAKNFKKRYGGHKASLKSKKENGNTNLSTYYWKELEAGKDPVVSWSILDKGLKDFNPTSGRCSLCTREKYYILFEADKASLNGRQEIFGACRHRDAKLLEKKPPDH